MKFRKGLEQRVIFNLQHFYRINIHDVEDDIKQDHNNTHVFQGVS